MKNVYICLPYGFSPATSYSVYEAFRVSTLVKDPSNLSVNFLSPEKEMTSYLGTKHLIPKVNLKNIDVLITIGAAGKNKEEVLQHLEASQEWMLAMIKKARASGAIIASCCTGAYFLAKAGLLKKKKATTAWWMAPEIKAQFPDTEWCPDEIIISNGKVITGGGSMSALELIAELMGRLTTSMTKIQTEKILVLPYRRKNQRAYRVSSMVDHPDVMKALKYIKDNMADCGLEDLVSHMGMSSRTFHRFCMKNVKMSPYQWLKEIKLERAQKLLEQTELPVNEIAYRIGYDDMTSFLRSFKKSYGVTPAQYRTMVD